MELRDKIVSNLNVFVDGNDFKYGYKFPKLCFCLYHKQLISKAYTFLIDDICKSLSKPT